MCRCVPAKSRDRASARRWRSTGQYGNAGSPPRCCGAGTPPRTSGVRRRGAEGPGGEESAARQALATAHSSPGDAVAHAFAPSPHTATRLGSCYERARLRGLARAEHSDAQRRTATHSDAQRLVAQNRLSIGPSLLSLSLARPFARSAGARLCKGAQRLVALRPNKLSPPASSAPPLSPPSPLPTPHSRGSGTASAAAAGRAAWRGRALSSC